MSISDPPLKSDDATDNSDNSDDSDESVEQSSSESNSLDRSTYSPIAAIEAALAEDSPGVAIAWARPSSLDETPGPRWGVLLPFAALLALIPAIIAFALADGQTEKFEARVDVLHTITDPPNGGTDAIMANQQVAAMSRDLMMAGASAESIALDDVEENSSVQLVTPIDDTSSTVLRFAVRANSKPVAERLLAAHVGAYLFSTLPTEQDGIEARIDQILDSLLDEREFVIEDLELLRALARPATEIAVKEAQLEQIFRDIEVQTTLKAGLEPDGTTVTASTVGTPFVDPDPVEPRPLFAAAAGLALGLMLAAAFLFARVAVRNW